jgi:hypothetical protein
VNKKGANGPYDPAAYAGGTDFISAVALSDGQNSSGPQSFLLN